MSDLSRYLGKRLMPTHFIITICTVGGVDSDGNEVDEPVVFDGDYNEAVDFFTNEDNLSRLVKIYDDMSDGYIIVESDHYSREIYDVYEILKTIEEM